MYLYKYINFDYCNVNRADSFRFLYRPINYATVLKSSAACLVTVLSVPNFRESNRIWTEA